MGCGGSKDAPEDPEVPVTPEGPMLFAMGGEDGNGSTWDAFRMYDPKSDAWVSRSSLKKIPRGRPQQIKNLGMTALDGKIYVGGGENENGDALAALWMYDPKSDSWAELSWMKKSPKGRPQQMKNLGMTALDGKIYVGGGEDENGDALAALWMYDPKSDSWAELSSMKKSPKGSLQQTKNLGFVGVHIES